MNEHQAFRSTLTCIVTRHRTKQDKHLTVQTTVVLGSKPVANLHYEGLDETLQLT